MARARTRGAEPGPTLVLMGKPPRMGRVKTRLAREIGPVSAVSFYRASVGRLLRRLDGEGRWRLVLAVNAPSEERYAAWPNSVARMAQGTGNLGDRMGFVIRQLPPGPVIIIGTDSPQVEPSHIAQGFNALGHDDAVFGPADDGGYWLIGLARRRPAPRLFQGVRWSTEHALDDTAASLPRRARVAQLPVLTDVDCRADLACLRSDYGPFRQGPWQAKRGAIAAP